MQYPSARTGRGAARNLRPAARSFFALALLVATLLSVGVVGKFTRPVKAAAFTVCAVGCTHTTIQAAVDAADITAETDTITVQAGTYNERVIIPPSEPGLTINGANANISACTGTRGAESIVGATNGAFDINAANVTINGFTIQGVTMTLDAGVHALNTSGAQILNNIIQNNVIGILIGGSGALIQGNNIRNNTNPGSGTSTGIYSDIGLINTTITANCFSGQQNAATNIIGAPAVSGTVNNISLTNNTATNDAAYSFYGGTNLTITGNTNINSFNHGVLFGGGVNGATVTTNLLFNAAAAGLAVRADFGGTNANITASCNRIVNNDIAGLSVIGGAHTGTLPAENNWWGCNAGPGPAGCNAVFGDADFTPWLVLTFALSPNPPMPGGVATLTASLNTNSAGMSTGCNLTGVPVTFASTCGTVNPVDATLTNGTANATLTTPNPVPSCAASATIDNQAVTIFTCVGTPPTFVNTLPVSRQQGNASVNLQIATVMDAEDAENNLVVSANGMPSATVNGVTISNFTVNAAGQVRADIAVTCTATTANFTLGVTDTCPTTVTTPFTVNITPNTPPSVGNYPDTTVVTGGTLTITPDVPPSDNNTVASVTATAPPPFTGTFTGNTSSGGVTVMNANPLGSHTVTVTVTDNCGATTTRQFTLTVDPCGATLSKQRELFAANGGADSFNVNIGAGCMWTAVSNDPWIVVNSPVGTATGPGTVSYTVMSHTAHMRRVGSITVAGQIFRVLQGAMFDDVPLGALFYTEIGKLSALGITIGCGDGSNFCPDDNTSREQMAIFIERAIGVFNPPEPSMQTFADVPPTRVGYPFIEDLVARGITQGCDAGPPRRYCPDDAVTRDQMAIFILRGLGVFVPPPGPVTPTFSDVPNSGATDFSYEFIEEFFARGITQGCDLGPPRRYCPFDPVSRRQMAVFLLRAFGG